MIEAFFFDYDGVILDSLKVKDNGFRAIFSGFDPALVETFMAFHKKQGGMSRYAKVRYFYEELLHQAISEEEVQVYAGRFGDIMKRELTNRDNLIEDTISFLQDIKGKYPVHVISGADEKELIWLSTQLGILDLFTSVHGSPPAKNDLTELVLKTNSYNPANVRFIGDSGNDYEAAARFGIPFRGYNNPELKQYGGYLDSVHDLKKEFLSYLSNSDLK